MPLHLLFLRSRSRGPPSASRPQRRHSTLVRPTRQSTCPSCLRGRWLASRSPAPRGRRSARRVVSASVGQRWANDTTHLYHLIAVERAVLAAAVGESASASFMPDLAALSASMLPYRSSSVMRPSATSISSVWALTFTTVRSLPSEKSPAMAHICRHRSAPSRAGETHHERPSRKPLTTSALSVWMTNGGAALRSALRIAWSSARTDDG